MLLIHGWYGHLTRVKVKYYISSTVPLMKYQKNPNTSYICVSGPSITYSAVGAALTFTESTRRTPAKRGGRANMLHATLTSCLVKEIRKNNNGSSTLWRHSVLEREDDSFERPHQTFTLCPSVKCQTGFQSSQQCREKRNTGGVVWEGPLTQFTIQLPQKLWERRSSRGESCNL